MDVFRHTQVELVSTLYHLMMHGRSESGREELLEWLDGIDLGPYTATVEAIVGAEKLQEMEDDMLLSALGLTREKASAQVGSRHVDE